MATPTDNAVWSLDDAKASFEEVVRRARKSGPQYVAVSGRRAVAVVEAEELDRLRSLEAASPPLVDFLESLYAPGLDLDREPDIGRDVAL